ncbi:hypothetical protein BDV97DRAFT_279548, partial [Delphinella strobiligena]
GVCVAQVVGLTASAYLAGAIAGISFTTPAILDSPAPLLVKQWKKIFDSGKVVAPPLSIISAAIFGGLAYREPKGSAAFTLYTVAAVLVPSIVPYTLLVMKPTNDKLNEKAESLATTSLEDAAAEAGVAKEETAHGLLDKWITLNLGRSLLPLIGTICAAWASVDKYEVLALADITVRSGANRLG